LFVTNFGGTVGEYNMVSGAAVNSGLVTGLTSPRPIALLGGNLFVGSAGQLGQYSASGAAINPALVSPLTASGLAVVPEPSSLMLLAGAGGLAGLRRRSRRPGSQFGGNRA
jgi:hypothetical protein